MIAVLALGTRCCIGGALTEVSGRSRAGLAGFDIATGELDTSFSPSTNANVSRPPAGIPAADDALHPTPFRPVMPPSARLPNDPFRIVHLRK